jgi:putative hydrolase of the HAD superfamily
MEKTNINPNNKEIKNIVFDLCGVIVNLNEEKCKAAFEKIGADMIVHRWPDRKFDDIVNAANSGRLDAKAFCQKVRELGDFYARDQEIMWAWNELLMPIREEKRELLLSLGSKYRLFLLSNTNDIHWDKCAEQLLPMRRYYAEDYFEKIFLSYKMRLLKPSTDIFAQMIIESDIDPKDTLYIDDTESNCRMARRLGFEVLHETTGDDWMKCFK